MKKRFVLTMAAGIAAAPLIAQNPPEKIDVGNLDVQMMDQVVVPVPSEIFNVLDNLGSPNWGALLRNENFRASQDRAQTALLLGTVIADGFIAVEARNSEQVKELGREILDLSASLGVRESVISRSNSIIELAEKDAWRAVRRELDGALSDVRNAMQELGDADLAQLVSLGGWMRGTEAVSKIVGEDFKTDTAGLLHQPRLLDHFRGQLDGLSEQLRNKTLVQELRSKLEEMRPLIIDPEISRENVTRLHGITSSAVSRISNEKA